MILSQAGRREMRRLAKLQSAGSYLEVGARLRELGKDPPKSPRIKARQNPEYLRWIRQQPCLVGRWTDPEYFGGSCPRSEAAHPHADGTNLKGPDRDAVPFCAQHHRTDLNSWHQYPEGPEAFCEANGIDLESERNRLRGKYEKETGRKV
jgi:hypothetical protein